MMKQFPLACGCNDDVDPAAAAVVDDDDDDDDIFLCKQRCGESSVQFQLMLRYFGYRND